MIAGTHLASQLKFSGPVYSLYLTWNKDPPLSGLYTINNEQGDKDWLFHNFQNIFGYFSLELSIKSITVRSGEKADRRKTRQKYARNILAILAVSQSVSKSLTLCNIIFIVLHIIWLDLIQYIVWNIFNMVGSNSMKKKQWKIVGLNNSMRVWR